MCAKKKIKNYISNIARPYAVDYTKKIKKLSGADVIFL